MLDKTFPTLDCSACILTPKMVAGRPAPEHQAHDLQRGGGGRRLRRQLQGRRSGARRPTSTTTSATAAACARRSARPRPPTTFEQGKAKRKAIYTLFPQAVPNKPVIDREACTYFKDAGESKGNGDGKAKAKCRRLREALQDEGHRLRAAGPHRGGRGRRRDPRHRPRRCSTPPRCRSTATASFPTSTPRLEFERMVNSGGFTRGEIQTQRRPAPQGGGHHPLRREPRPAPPALLLLDLLHVLAEVRAPDPRAHRRRGLQLLHRHALRRERLRGVLRPAAQRGRALRARQGGLGRPRRRATLGGGQAGGPGRGHAGRRRPPHPPRHGGPGQRPRARSERRATPWAALFGVSRNQDGFFIEQHPKLNPVGTPNQCVFIAGTCAGPKDIPHTVAQASAAAAGRHDPPASSGKVDAGVDRGARCRTSCARAAAPASSCAPTRAISFDEELHRAGVDET